MKLGFWPFRRRSAVQGAAVAVRTEAAARDAIAVADDLRDAKKFAAAAQGYRHAIELNPRRPDLLVQLGNMLKDAGDFGAAVAAYEKASEANPQDGDIHLQRGRALKLAGDEDAAIVAFRSALFLDPVLVGAADELGRLVRVSAEETGVRSALSAQGPIEVAGWAFDTNRPEMPVTIEVEIGGTHYLRMAATVERGDLKSISPGIVGGGFSFALPPGEAEIEVAVRARGEHLRGSPFRTRLRALTRTLAPFYHEVKGRAREAACPLPEVAIIVPVHGAARQAAACIEAVIAYTAPPANLIVIDDASPGREVAEMLARYAGVPGVRILQNELNLGYTRTVNRGIAEAERADVVLLNSDTAVGPRWLDMMRQAALSARDIASVTAVSDNAGAFTLPEPDRPTRLPNGWSNVDLQRLVAQASGRFWPEVVTGNGFCLYLRRAALDSVGVFDEGAFPRGYGEENDWCMRAGKLGWRHLVDDRVLVHHERSASFGEEKTALIQSGRAVMAQRHPEYATLVAAFHRTPGLAEARRRVRVALAAPANPPRPRVLFVVSSETGGTPLTNRDLMAALRQRYEPLLLHCDSRTLTLMRPGFDGDGDTVLARHGLSEPISFARHVSREYDECVAGWLADHAVEFVHIRHLAWHSLNLPAVAQGMGLPVTLSFHDFYTACPTVKLVDETTTYCAGRCSQTSGDCKPDLWRLAEVPPLKHRFIYVWRERFDAVFRSCDAFVTTSQSARSALVATFPALSERRFDVIAHGRDFASFEPPGLIGPAPVLDILVPGNLSPAKGRDIIKALAERDLQGRLRFHLLGEVYPALDGPAIVNYGRYERSEFLVRAKATGAQIGFVFSLWAETYCHTLTEMWSAGLPVAAFDFGAVAERLRVTGAGWILPHEDVDALYEAVVGLADNIADRAAKAEKVRAWQEGEGVTNSCAAMAERYATLYAELGSMRLAFAHPASEFCA